MKKVFVVILIPIFLVVGLNIPINLKIYQAFAGCSEPSCRSSDCPSDQVCRTPKTGGCSCVPKVKPKKASVDEIDTTTDEEIDDSGDNEHPLDAGE